MQPILIAFTVVAVSVAAVAITSIVVGFRIMNRLMELDDVDIEQAVHRATRKR